MMFEVGTGTLCTHYRHHCFVLMTRQCTVGLYSLCGTHRLSVSICVFVFNRDECLATVFSICNQGQKSLLFGTLGKTSTSQFSLKFCVLM